MHPQRGIQVADITTRFIREAFGLRKMLEMQAVRSFAQPDNEHQVTQLMNKTLQVLESARTDVPDEVLETAVDIDWEMHDKIIDHIDNGLLTEVYQVNVARLRLIKVSNRMSHQRAIAALGEHMSILEHCRNGDGNSAATALGEHIDIAMNRALQGK
ncbi:GntR family transcriptional regulator [Devosia algicola]|uniref:GntR family transcriptional regulator n=1 Tax=Devosia algicola TaxID=3026418 RepID=A0ABY7YSC9_9HYPH|nr:GntR family transcriptional regulator [Devosia algicola]WDR04263.1 GntR family transcriptional regulator [Devosia algicola]